MILLSGVCLVSGSSNTSETPSTTYNETVTPAIIIAGRASVWTFAVVLALVVIAAAIGVVYCGYDSRSSE